MYIYTHIYICTYTHTQSSNVINEVGANSPSFMQIILLPVTDISIYHDNVLLKVT